MKRSAFFCLGILLMLLSSCLESTDATKEEKDEVSADKPDDSAMLTFFDNPRNPILPLDANGVRFPEIEQVLPCPIGPV